MIIDYAMPQEQCARKPRYVVVRVVLTVLLGGLLSFAGIVGASVNAFYASHAMPRAQFDATARFGVWQQGQNGTYRTFTLNTPDATIAGIDRAAGMDAPYSPSGEVHLKAVAIIQILAFGLAVAVAVFFGFPWLYWWVRSRMAARWR